MAFDPITFSEVLNSKSPIGSAIRVVASFSDPKYLKSNQIFDANDYPELGAQVAAGFHGDIWEKSSIPSIPSDYSVSVRNIGYVTAAWSTASANYFITRGIVAPYGTFLYKSASTAPNSDLTLVKTIPWPSGAVVAQYSMVGTQLIISFADRSYYIYDTVNDPEMNSPVQRIMPATAQAYPYIFAAGGGIMMAVTSGATLGTAGASFKSTDGGATWATPTTVAGIAASTAITGMAYGNGTFVVISNSTATGNYAYTTTGNSWAGGLTSPATARSGLAFDPIRNVFMAFPIVASNVILESSNGSTWTSGATCPVASSNRYAVQVASNGTVVAGLDQGTAVSTFSSGTLVATYTHANDPASGGSPASLVLGNNVVKFSTSSAFTAGPLLVNYASVNNITSWSSQGSLLKSSVVNYLPYYSGNSVVLMDAVYKSSSLYATTKWNGIVSTDSGKTWQTTVIDSGSDLTFWTDIAATPQGFFAVGKISYTGTTNLVYATSTDGVSWTYVNTNGTPAAISAVNSITCNQDGVIMISTNTNATNLLRTANYGASWTTQTAATGVGAGGQMYSSGSSFMFITSTNTAISTTNAKYSVDGITWSSPVAVPTLSTTVSYPISGASGPQSINNVCVVLMGRANTSTAIKDVMYTINGGINWVLASLPSVATSSSPQSVAIVNGVVIIPLANGYILRTTDITTQSMWEIATVDSLAGPITGVNPSMIAGNFTNDEAILLSPSSVTSNFVIRGVTEETTLRRVPYMPADVPGTTWCLRAK